MKKLLSLALTLTLALGLVSPAVAIGPEPHILEEMAIQGRRQGYIENHPDEVAGLTEDELYTYVDARIEVENRLNWAEQDKEVYPQVWEAFDAQACLEEHCPGQSKADFMAEHTILTEEELVNYLFGEYGLDGYILYDADADGDGVVDSYTEEQIAELTEKYGLDAPEVTLDVPTGDLGYSIKLPEPLYYDYPTPTLTLCVNGVDTEVAVTAEDGVTYADADALRQFFGPETVPADKEGLLPIRATAEAAGWDVGWYSSWWSGRQEVQLWDRASYLAALEGQFPKELIEFVPGSTVGGETGLFAETPTTVHQTATVDLTRFSTLDGDETFRLTFDAETTTGGGVADVTVTFDAAQLLQLFNTDALENATRLGGFSLTQLRQFLKAGVMEFVFDLNEGSCAYNVPLLGLIDEEYAGWQVAEVPGYAELLDLQRETPANRSWAEMMYQTLLDSGESSGAKEGLSQYGMTTTLMAVFLGEDRFATGGNTFTYTLTTQAVNELMTALIATNVYNIIAANASIDGVELPTLSIFKAFDLTVTSTGGTTKADLHVRLDADGIAAAIVAAGDSYDPTFSWAGVFGGGLMRAWDMDITASVQGNAARSTGSVDIHWNNVGKLSVKTTATTQTTPKTPRSIDDIVR